VVNPLETSTTPVPARDARKALKFIGTTDAETAYMESIRNSRKLSRTEERDVAMRIQNGDHRAVNILVSANLKFVVSVCRNYRNQGLPFGDLINEGNLGLIRAAQRFDAGKGFRFISYAVWWIRQGILVALSEQTRFLKVSPGRVHAVAKIAKETRKLEQRLGRAPTLEEISSATELSPEKISEYILLAAKSVSMSSTAPDGGPSLEESLEDADGEPSDEGAEAFLMRKNIKLLLESLDERKADVLKLYFGIGSGSSLPLSEIAARLNLTRERVRQIKAHALTLLRHPARSRIADNSMA
jgi:RNA polymerase primary sigma factor